MIPGDFRLRDGNEAALELHQGLPLVGRLGLGPLGKGGRNALHNVSCQRVNQFKIN